MRDPAVRLAPATIALLLALAFAGCAGEAPPPATATPDDPAPTPPPATPATATPSPAGTAAFRLLDLTAEPALVDLGLPVTLTARIVNEGDAAGIATVRFDTGDGTRSAAAAAGPGEGTVVRIELPTIGPGERNVSAHLGPETANASYRVVAPHIVELTARGEGVEPCGAVRITTGFLNAGDGRARGARADLEIFLPSGEPVARYATTIGDVPPGERAESVAETTDIRAACPGESERSYPIVLVVHVDGSGPSRLTGRVFA